MKYNREIDKENNTVVFQIIDKKNKILEMKRFLIKEFYGGTADIYVLGINDLTDNLLGHIQQRGLAIKGIIDDYTSETYYKGNPILRMDNVSDKNAIVVSCIVDGRITTAHRNLADKGFRKILNYLELALVVEELDCIHYCTNNIHDIEDNKDKYLWVHNILADKKSKWTLENIIDLRYNYNIEATKDFVFDLENQYFDELVKFGEDEVFVDCGGFDGKTTEKFLQICPDYKKIYYFEPVKRYYEISIEKLNKHRDIFFFNKGTHKKKSFEKFIIKGSESFISDEGNDVIEAVRLDDVIEDKISYIKMDVEGAEYDSLIGAERLIRAHKPKLAICVYHEQKDFWRIPELVLSYNKDYKVYLRHYTEGLLETVMYFI